MNDPLNLLKSLTRPQLLLAAARHASGQYRRDRMLRKLLKAHASVGPGEAVMQLIAIEQEIEDARRQGLASYSAARHIVVLAALVAEGRSLESRAQRVQAKASATSSLRLVM